MDKTYSLLVIIILLCSSNISTQTASDIDRLTSLSSISFITSPPIIISEDSNFTDYGLSGDGSEGNPFIIENLNITTTEGKGIYIYNTSKHFIIRYCSVNASKDGIVIDTVKEGTAVLTNNICVGNVLGGIQIYHSPNSQINNNICNFNNYLGILVRNSSRSQVNNNSCLHNGGSGLGGIGIYVRHSDSSTINNNTCNLNIRAGIFIEDSPSSYVADNKCKNNDYHGGIAIYESNKTMVVNNLCVDNVEDNIKLFESNNSFVLNNYCSGSGFGIVVTGGGNVTIDNNSCTDNYLLGMHLSRAEGSIVTNNKLYNTGFRFYEPNKENFHSYVVVDNTVNGKKFGYFAGVDDLTITKADYGQLYFADCSNVRIKNQYFSNTFSGLTMFYCTNSLIQKTVSLNNWYSGIILVACSTIEIINCTFTSNYIGILFENADRNELSYNTLVNNTKWGVVLDQYSSNNTVHHNTFLDNNYYYGTAQARDDGKNNTWYDEETLEGNYWSDYFTVVGSYYIDGYANTQDLYPLSEPPIYKNKSIYYSFLSLVVLIPIIVFCYFRFSSKRKR